MNRYYLSAGMYIFFLSVIIAQEPRFIDHDIEEIKRIKLLPYPDFITHGQSKNTIIQDYQCLIWIGTDVGLASFDGTTLQLKDLNPSDTMVQVTSLFEDNTHRIWVGTASGEIYYLDSDRMPYLFDSGEGHPKVPITGITQDTKGYIWFATYGEGAYVYGGSRMFQFGSDEKLSDLNIYAIQAMPGGEIWLGTDAGINICTFNRETEKKEIRILDVNDGLPDQIITALASDPKGNIWIGSMNHGVVCFDRGTQKITRPFVSPAMENVTSFAFFDEDEVWIGTNTKGVWRYSPFFNPPRKLERHIMNVNDLLCDVEGNIWMVTEKGMLLSAIRSFESIELNVPEIQALYCDHSDQVWIGTKSGLFHTDHQTSSSTKSVRDLPAIDLNIKALYEDPFHHLWIGTFDKGLFIFDPRSGKVRHIGSVYKEGGITIMSMAATRKSVWIATLGGVISYPTDRDILSDPQPDFQLLSDPWKSDMNVVYQVYVDSKDRAWFATDGKGVYCIDSNTVTHYTGNDTIELKTVYSVCEDEAGQLWFNTSADGLIEYNDNLYKRIDENLGLRNLEMASIITAGNGNIILTHNYGIDVMEPVSGHFMYYSEEIGINESAPNLNSVTKDSHGHVYTSGTNTIFKYYNAKEKFSIHPRTQITGISVNEYPVDIANDHKFRSKQNSITFNYVGLWYTSPSSVNYQYKLDGYDLQWKQSKDNEASYSKLSPGEYTFHVMATENGFFQDEPMAEYSFTIKKPFWLEYSFLSLMAICSLGAILWLVKSREKRSERQALLKKEMIESQLSALKAQINPHFLFNSFNTLITIIDENSMKPEVAIEYVEKLSDFYRSILQYREHETISLEEEWELVQNFMYLLEKRYGHNLRLHMDAPPKDSYILPMTLQMLVENALKHNIISETLPLDLFITVEDDAYVMVSNTLQPKSRAEPSTQFGLQSIIKRYQLLSERKVIVQQDQHTFKVSIPIIKKPGI